MTKMLFVSRCSVKILVSDENMEKKKTWIEMKHKKRLTVPFSRVRKIRKKQENRQRQKRKYHLHASNKTFFFSQ